MSTFTDRYVYVNSADKDPIDAFRLQIDLGPNNERVPYIHVEPMSATLATNDLTSKGFTIKCEEIAMNYYSSDLKGSTLTTLEFNALIDGEHVFTLPNYASQLVFGGQTRFLTIFVEDVEGVRINLTTISPFSILFKCRFPVVGSIETAYRQQIPL